MSGRNLNPNSYPLGALAQAGRAIKTIRQDAEEEARRLIEDRVSASRWKLLDELAKAKAAGVGATLMAQTTGYSRNTIYDFLGQIRPELTTAAEVTNAPHSDWFGMTLDDDYFQITLPQNWTPYGMTSSYPKGTTFEGRYALHVRSGRHTFRDFRELKTISQGAASGIANDPKVLAKFQEWASVAVPDLETADVPKASENPPEALPHGKRQTTLDDLYTD